jgi:hypothetical protein
MQPVLNLAEGEPVVVVVAVKKAECLEEEDALALDVGVVKNALILGERGAVVMVVEFFLLLMMVRIERGTFLSLLLLLEEEEEVG